METTIGQTVRSIQRLLPRGYRVRQRETPPHMFKGRKEKNAALHVHREPRVGARGGREGVKGACPAITFKVNLGRALLSVIVLSRPPPKRRPTGSNAPQSCSVRCGQLSSRTFIEGLLRATKECKLSFWLNQKLASVFSACPSKAEGVRQSAFRMGSANSGVGAIRIHVR